MTYVPRDGKAHCVMTYIERVSPVRSLPFLLYRVLEEDPDFVRTETYQIARFVSVEGEYGARIVVKGESRGMRIGYVVAALFAEDFTTRLVGRVEEAHLDRYTEIITNLAQNDRLGLGVRRRRIAFQPPANWHPVVGTLDVSLFPPDYPRPRCVITVNPAEPLTAPNPREVVDEHDRRVGLAAPEDVAVQSTRTPHGLKGELVRTVRPLPGGAGKMLRYHGVLSDDRYWYTAKLEALEQPGLEPYIETFTNLLGSVESIPATRSTTVAPTAFPWND